MGMWKRRIEVKWKEGGPDPANNFKLAQVIAKAKANNMPRGHHRYISRDDAARISRASY